ncbi:PIG-L deacetylase family protein [Brevibacillus sp. B_LB10_24]|uniref:PIG-L deacetylase family protein n=1 Tax=Brevibacillus sp. B_LB10_24 TaxID=3380645 RepID=UPI0038BA7697
MSKVMVVAPHPDDETLGCGGTLLKHKELGDDIHWLIITSITEKLGFSQDRMQSRINEIEKVSNLYGFTSVHNLGLPTTHLDAIPINEIVAEIGRVFQTEQPEIVYIPYRGDVHTDHKFVFDAVVSCTKWFRYPFIKRVLAYETLSETDFGLNPDTNGFRPNVFVDITNFLDQKINIMEIFRSEISEHPFPRSKKAITALAHLRGAAAGSHAAEAFMLLKEMW